MAKRFPDLSAPEWTPGLAALLERASLAIGRLDARISGSPVRAPWLERASWTGFALACRAQGAELDEIDIFALACGAALPGRGPVAFGAEVREGLLRWQRMLARAPSRHWRELGPYPLDLPRDWGDRPALLRALELVARHARAEPGDAAWCASPSLLAALDVTRTPLPCLAIADKALRLNPHDRDPIMVRYLKQMRRRADEGLDRLDALETDRLRAAHAIAAAPRPGKMVALAALLQRRPISSPLGLARMLGLTKSGAGKLLARAADAGLVVEISGRQAWKLYVTPDLGRAFGFVPRTAGRPVEITAPPSLDPVLAQFDEELAALDATLARLGVSVPPDTEAAP